MTGSIDILMPLTVSRRFGARSVSISSISRMTATGAGDRDVFLFHSPEYLIKHLDLGMGKIVRSFRREYDRVKYAAKPTKTISSLSSSPKSGASRGVN